MKQKPDMNFWGLWNLSFGFFGVQIAYALQSAHLAYFRHLGCRPSQLELFLDSPSFDGYPRAAYRWYIK